MPGPAQPFKDGNATGGRPKKTEEMRKAEDLMRERSLKGAMDLIELSEKSPDDQVRAKLLIYRMDRVFGKPVQAISGPDGEPLNPPIDLGRFSDEQLRAFVALGRLAIPDGGGDPTGGGGTTAT